MLKFSPQMFVVTRLETLTQIRPPRRCNATLDKGKWDTCRANSGLPGLTPDPSTDAYHSAYLRHCFLT